MSWKTVNEVLSLGLIDQGFCQELLADPFGTIQAYDFQLTEHERQVLSQMKADTLAELSQQIIDQLAPDQISSRLVDPQ